MFRRRRGQATWPNVTSEMSATTVCFANSLAFTVVPPWGLAALSSDGIGRGRDFESALRCATHGLKISSWIMTDIHDARLRCIAGERL